MDEAFPSSGAIDPTTFPFFVFDLHRRSATGSLKVEGPTYHKALYFRSGRFLFASSNDPADQLGSILVETGKITQEQLDDVNSKVGPGNPLAKLLSESGIVSQRELAEAARSKVESILSDAISYETGSFEFEDGVLPKGAVDLKLATERVAMAAVRRIEDREFVLRHLGGLDVVLTQTSDEVADESAILAAQFDGQRPLKEAASLASMEEFDAAKVACAMVFLGWAEVAGAGAPEVNLEPEPDMQLDFGDDTGPDLDIGEPGGTDETVMLGTSPEVDTAATMADATPLGAEPDGGWPGAIAGEEEPAAEPAWPGAVGEPEVEPEPEPEPTQAWPGAISDDEEAPASGSESAWPSAIGEGDEAATVVSSAAALEPPAARRAKPSSEDLAALDALLNTKSNDEGPLAPIEKGASPDWQPQFLNGTGRGRRAGRSSGSKSRIVAGIIAVLAIGGGGAYWYLVMRPASGTQIAAGSAPPVTTQAPAPTTQPAASPSPATDASTDTTTPPSGAAAQPDTAPEAPKTAATPAPTTAVATPPTRTTAAGSLDDARRALRGGQLDSAARAFAAHARDAGTHTLQVLVACVADNVTKAIGSASDDALFIVPLKLKGRSCYRVCWGLFDSEAAARAAAGRVPAYFRDGGSRPRVVTTASIIE